jgi:diaminopimelate dehydrogenase
MLKVAIVGFGNIGSKVYDAVKRAEDMQVICIVEPFLRIEGLEGIAVKSFKEIGAFGKPDVAVVCIGSADCPDIVKEILAMGINTVDSFDIHSKIWQYSVETDAVAKQYGVSAFISAGWDPGTDSLIRALFLAMSPEGETFTNFGPGMSMGHSVAARKIEGIKDAVSITVPKGKGIHGRQVFVAAQDGYNKDTVADNIKKDSYFCNDETEVVFVSDIAPHRNTGHGVNLVRGKLAFDMRIDNPSMTGQILTAAARAVVKQKPGCYTIVDVPVVDLLPGKREEVIRDLV